MLHLHGRLVLIRNNAGRAVGQTHRCPYVFHARPQYRSDLIDQRFQGVARVGCGFVFQILAGRCFVDGFELDLLVFVHRGENDLVNLIVEENDFDLFLSVDFQKGRSPQRAAGPAHDVVDALLALPHAGFHLGQTGPAVSGGRFHPNQVEQGFAVGEISIETLLERAVKMLDELQVFFRLCRGNAFEFGQHLLYAGGADAAESFVLLENFPADIQRQVFAVDDSAQEAQICGHQFTGVIGDEYTLHIKLHARLVVGLVHVQRGARWDIKQGGVFQSPFGFGVKPEERIFPIA